MQPQIASENSFPFHKHNTTHVHQTGVWPVIWFEFVHFAVGPEFQRNRFEKWKSNSHRMMQWNSIPLGILFKGPNTIGGVWCVCVCARACNAIEPWLFIVILHMNLINWNGGFNERLLGQTVDISFARLDMIWTNGCWFERLQECF